jgi:hypothetical protein
MWVHNGELETLFGRGKFAELNEQYRALDVVGSPRGRLTRAYRVVQDIQDSVSTRLRAANDAGDLMVMVRPNGWQLRTPPQTINKTSLSESSIWRATDIGLAVLADVEALARLDEWLDRAAAAGPASREGLLRAIQIEPHTNLEYLRKYLERLRCQLRAELPGRGYIASQYRQASTGRLFEVGPGPGLQGAPRIIKRCALNGRWAYDIDSCHPNIICHLAPLAGVRAEAMSDYVEHKVERRRDVAARTGLSVKQAKSGLLAVTYGSRQRFGDADDAVTAELGPELAAAFWADEYVRWFMRDLERVGRKIESDWRRGRGSIRNPAGCWYSTSRRHGEQRKDTWSTRLAHIVQGYEVAALHSVVTAFPDQMLVLEHDGWTARSEMIISGLERVIAKAIGFPLKVEGTRMSLPRMLQFASETSDVEAA